MFFFTPVFAASSYFGGWTAQTPNTPYSVMGISFPSSLVGYLCGPTAIEKTINGGTTWSSIPVSAIIYGISAPTETTAFSLYGISAGICQIYGTTNGADFSSMGPIIASEPRGIQFINTREGWALCASVVGITTNGAASVTQISISSSNLYGLHFIDSSVGFVVGYDTGRSEPTINKSADGGNTWTRVYLGTGGETLKSVSFSDSSNGWAVGTNGLILKTTTGGASSSWSAVSLSGKIDPSLVTTNFNKVFALSSNICWVFGDNNVIIRTLDGGTTWNVQSVPAGTQNILTASFVSGGTSLKAWAGGASATVYSYNLPIISTVSPGTATQGATVVVTAEGFNFEDSPTVTISPSADVVVSAVEALSSTKIQFTLAVGATATTDARSLSVTNTDGTSTAKSNAIAITSSSVSAAPNISSFTPILITRESSAQFEMIGSNFQSGITILSSPGLVFSPINFESATKVTGTVSASATADLGSQSITAINPDSGAVTMYNVISVLPSVPSATDPTISSVVDNKGYKGEASKVTINGTNFPYPLNGRSVDISLGDSGISVPNIDVLSTTQINATFTISSSSTTGLHNLTLTVYGTPIQAVSKTSAFNVLAARQADTATIISQNPWRSGDLPVQVDVGKAGVYKFGMYDAGGNVYSASPYLVAGTNKVIIPSSRGFSSGFKKLILSDGQKIVGTYKLMVVH